MTVNIKRPVFLCGENPGMTLFSPGLDRPVAVASYWHVTYSPHGIGNALVLWLDEDPGSSGVYTDNLPLARILINTLIRHFPEFHEIPVASLSCLQATCQHEFNGLDEYRVTCETKENQFVVKWTELLDHKLVLWPGFPAGSKVFDLSTVICPCRQGSITINGNVIPGEVQTSPSSDGHPSSTAFLAFAETWLGPFNWENR